jgi:hypothetical protein
MIQPDDEESWCVACGSPVRAATDRTFAVSPERDLCFACSIERGGEYDEQTDRWVVPPRLEPSVDLRDERF